MQQQHKYPTEATEEATEAEATKGVRMVRIVRMWGGRRGGGGDIKEGIENIRREGSEDKVGWIEDSEDSGSEGAELVRMMQGCED